jgi:putative SOS response-associated peptidase YedK
MCGRFIVSYSLEELKGFLSETFDIFDFENEYEPRYNVAPGQQVLSVISDGEKYRVGTFKWGLVPSFSKDEKVGYKMINARSETVTEKYSFKESFKNKRCVILSDGFYEWDKVGGSKGPYLFTKKDDKMFGYAGLWSRFIQEDGTPLHTCTILTTKANPLLSDIHDRMPIMMNDNEMKLWLDPKVKDEELLISLLKEYDENDMKRHQVSKRVNKVINDDPTLINEVESFDLFS